MCAGKVALHNSAKFTMMIIGAHYTSNTACADDSENYNKTLSYFVPGRVSKNQRFAGISQPRFVSGGVVKN